MTLKARKTSHRGRIGWARIKSGPSHGWKLPRKRFNIPGLTKKRIVLLSIGLFALLFLANLSSSVYLSPHYEHRVFQMAEDPTVIIGTRVFHVLLPNGDTSEFNTFTPSGGTVGVVGCSSFEANSKCIQMNSNSTHTAIALTKTPFSISSAANNNLALAEGWLPSGLGPGFTTSTGTFGFYLTTNATVPTTPNYDPTADKSVVMVSLMACTAGCTTNNPTIFHRVNLLRNIGDTLAAEDTGCGPNSGSRFFCNTQTYSITGPLIDYQLLNYTGFTNTPAGSNCSVTQTSGSGCSFDQNNPAGNGGTISTTFISPLKIQAHEFYYGLYVSSTGPAILFGTDNNNDDLCCGVKTVNLAEATNGVTNAGFFQPLVDALVATGVFILRAILTFLAVITGSIRIGLNAIGSFFGWGNIGDSFINAANGVANTIAAVAAAITSFLSGIVARGLDLINIVTTFSTVFFTGLQKFLSEMSTITGGIVTIFSKLFLYGGAFYFLYDIILYFQLTGDAGFEGIGTWIGFNKWAAFSVFGLITRILNALIGAFDWVLSHIPTISARMPEGGFPGVPQLASGEFPGLRVPTGHVTKLREGDPAAFFLWAVGGFLILPFYLGSAISPLAGLTAAVGCNPTTCFNNMLTTVGYPFAGLFIIIFVGVTITEILHGITDVGGQRIVIQNKLPAGFGQFKKAAKGEFQFETGRFAQFKKGRAKQAKSKAVERQETISREQAYENKHGSSVFS